MLVNCFATSQFNPLRMAMQDRLHQQARQTRRGGPLHARRATLNVRVSTAQYREHMFPFKPIIEGALEAGAHAAFLSGAGPTILAVTGGVGIADVGSDTMSQARAPCRHRACAALALPAPTEPHPRGSSSPSR